jgi:hypothetical protein
MMPNSGDAPAFASDNFQKIKKSKAKLWPKPFQLLQLQTDRVICSCSCAVDETRQIFLWMIS